MPRRIDLHTHSTASDGTTPPGDLVVAARAAGLDVVALTDHDTTAGVAAAAAALPAGLTLLPGAEISCFSAGPGGTRISLHLLAYLFDRAEPDFRAARQKVRAHRVTRAERMIERLAADGHAVTWERVTQLAGGTIGRPHVAQALVEQGLVPTVADAFTRDWIGHGGHYYVPKLELDVFAAIPLVRRAGGVPVFAHPKAVRRGPVVGDDVIAAMARCGLAGLEVDHPDHDSPTRAHLRGLAADLGLVVTGSSDFHGGNKPVGLGAETTAEAALESILAQAAGAVPVRPAS